MQKRKASRRKNKKSGKIRIIPLLLILTATVVLVVCAHLMQNGEDNILQLQYPIKYSEYVEKYSEEYGVPKSLVYAVIRTESGFRENAGSSAGALGLMQIIPDTFDWLMLRRGESENYVSEDLFDPEVNIDYGIYFLSWLLDRYEKEETAVAAYNAGFGAVDSWLENPEYSSDGVTLDYIPYNETRQYTERVSSAKKMYEKIYNM